MNDIGAAFTPQNDVTPISPEQVPRVISSEENVLESPDNSSEENVLETSANVVPDPSLSTGSAPTGFTAQFRRLVNPSFSCAQNGKAVASDLLERYTARYTALVKADPHMYRAAESLLSTLSYLATNRY
jgi:hypothetical protein